MAKDPLLNLRVNADAALRRVMTGSSSMNRIGPAAERQSGRYRTGLLNADEDRRCAERHKTAARNRAAAMSYWNVAPSALYFASYGPAGSPCPAV
jgi:hypothetical protein